MKKIITAFILMMVTAIAFALPSPKMIEDSLMYGDFTRARGMVQEVLREKPESARAHLLNAYILAKADKNAVAAANELDMAIRLDKKGDVKNSPLVGKVSSEIQNIKPVIPRPQQRVVVQQPQQHYHAEVARPAPVVTYSDAQPAYVAPVVVQKTGMSGFTKFMIFLAIAIVLILVLMYLNGNFDRREERVVYRSSGYSGSPRLSNVGDTTHVVHSTPVVSGSGGFGNSGTGTTIINNGGGSNGNGFLTGMLVSDMMHHSHHNHGGYDGYGRTSVLEEQNRMLSQQVIEQQAATSSVSSPVLGYEAQRQSFSSGSDEDSWTSSPSSSSSYSSSRDDDWGSSSSSSSSSSSRSSSYSSSSDSGSSSWSSSDSGSSSSDSGGSDW